MADNVTANAGSGGATFATDDISGVHYTITKVAYGALDAATLVSTSNGFPVAQQGTWSVTVVDGGSTISIDDGSGSITVDGSVSAVVAGDVAHDAADSGNPTKIGLQASTALSGLTLVANADRVNALGGVDGVQFVRPHCGLEDIVTGNTSNTDGTSTQVIAAAGAGIKQYLTSVTITNTSSSNSYCELKSGTTVRYTVPVPANGGVTKDFVVPLPPNAANEAWNFDMGAAISTAYCSMIGFKSKI